MRVVVATAVLVGGALLAYVPWSSGLSAQGQATHAAITPGETIKLWFDVSKISYECTVMEVRGDFVGCRRPDPGFGQARPDRWYNLRLIQVIDRPVKTE